MIPAPSTTAKAMARPFSGCAAISWVTTAVMTTVIGPVGSEISVRVPPKRAEEPDHDRPIETGLAPAPDATPKARAKGSEMTAVVNPPKRSPFQRTSSNRLSPREQTGPFSPIDHLPLYRRLPRKKGKTLPRRLSHPCSPRASREGPF